jgi:epoxyqueuosine reductase
MEDRIELSTKIRERALAEGFHKVGIVPVEALLPERERLQQWLDRGFHAGMQWMLREPEKRTDPRLLLPSAKSLIAVALNYHTPHKHEDDPDRGKISRYAWGDDYHDVIGEKIRSLLGWIKEQQPDVEGKVCVDAQPIMDKAWAVRAGLGWIGKHSNLITREFGSWVFLGELLLNIELEYDTKLEPDHCGSCTLCLDACPTKAITEPYVIDSNRCISYVTIEYRGEELPNEITPHLNNWLYGCDICQDVCPWNRFEKPTTENRFEPREGNISPRLDEIAQLTTDSYINRFRRSPIKRAKLAGLQRNARAILKH